MLWPIHPQPLSDEILSSWMIRLARANGFKVHSFYAHAFGRERQIWNRDIDHHAPPWLIEGLAERTGVPIPQIVSMTLRAYESIVFERLNETGMTRLVLPLGIYHRTRRAYGQQFCPLCLNEDREPYLRRRWRLALLVLCTRHAILLQDRCSACQRPLASHRADMQSRRNFPTPADIQRCVHCDNQISGTVTRATAEDLALQARLEKILENGVACVDGISPIYAPLFFSGLRILMSTLAAPKLRRSERKQLEFSGPRDRLAILRESMQLLDDWPRRFLLECATIRQAYSRITSDEPEIPYWLHSVLRDRLYTYRSPLPKKRIVSDRVARRLFASLEAEIERAVPGVHRLLLQRDRAMFALAREYHAGILDLIMLTTDGITTKERKPAGLSERMLANEHAQWYLRNVRCELSVVDAHRKLFVTSTGAPLKHAAVGARFAQAVRAARLGRWISGWCDWVRKP